MRTNESEYKRLEVAIYDLKAENAKLQKDKERLDWVLSHEGRYWLSSREDIDKETKGTQ